MRPYILHLTTTRGRVRLAIPLALVALALGALLPLVAGPRAGAAPKEIVLVARDMAFYLDGAGEANPVLRLQAGEQVRLVLRNEDPGYVHWLSIEGLPLRIGPVKSRASGSAELRVPGQPGTYTYVCSPHARMMTGRIEILPAP